jgi:hypothetical protein
MMPPQPLDAFDAWRLLVLPLLGLLGTLLVRLQCERRRRA